MEQSLARAEFVDKMLMKSPGIRFSMITGIKCGILDSVNEIDIGLLRWENKTG